MSIKYEISLTELNARNQIDIEKIIFIQPHMVKLTYSLNDNKIIFDAKIDEKDLLSNQYFGIVEKLIIVKNTLNISSLDEFYEFSLNPNNLVVLPNLDVEIVLRDVKSNYDEEVFVEKVKSLLFNLIQPKFKYEDYFCGGYDLVQGNKLLEKYVDVKRIDDFNKLLDQDIFIEREKINTGYHLLSNKSYKFSKYYKIVSLLTIVVLSLALFTFINKYEFSQTTNEIKTDFINQEYSSVIEKSKNININKLSNEDKYIIATSFVKLETLPQEKMKFVLSQIAPNTNEHVLNYWVYLSQDNFKKAYEEAYNANDTDLLIYGYLKELDYVNNSGTLSVDEKTNKKKELENKIEELTKEE